MNLNRTSSFMLPLVLFLIPSIFWVSQASAYVLPPGHVYDQWIKRTKHVHSLSYTKVYQQISGGDAQGPAIKVENVWIKRPGMIRVLDRKNNIEKRANAQRVFIIDQGQKKPSGLEVFDPLALFWMNKDAQGLTFRTEKVFGIPQGQVQWFLHDRRKHWMHGDPKQRFAVFSVDPFSPVMARKKDLTYVFKYQSQKKAQTPLFPNRIEVFERGTRKFEIVIKNLSINPSIPLDTFTR